MIALIFDYLGTISFAISGALVGMQRRMDIFGIAILALVTAVGGGMIRDTLVGNTPPSALEDGIYIAISPVTVVALLFSFRRLRGNYKYRRYSLYLYNLADTFGLASFTVTGALVGVAADPRSIFLLPVTLGLITAYGGGIIRDIGALRIPVVFRNEVYASASLAGGIVFCLVRQIATLAWAGPLAFLTVMLIRLLAIRHKLELPRAHRRDYLGKNKRSK